MIKMTIYSNGWACDNCDCVQQYVEADSKAEAIRHMHTTHGVPYPTGSPGGVDTLEALRQILPLGTTMATTVTK